jgi:hypothetical protein
MSESLAAAIRELATATREQTQLTRLLIAAMPARVEAELTKRSLRTVQRERAKRKNSTA